MEVLEYCSCGVKLDRKDVVSAAAAQDLVNAFWREHAGPEHGQATRRQYISAVSRHVARNARSNQPREPLPLLSAIARAEAQGRK